MTASNTQGGCVLQSMIPKVMCFQTKPSSEFIKILSKQSPFSFGWAFVNIFVTRIAAETCARHMWASCPMERCVQAHATGAQLVGFSTNLPPYTPSIRPYTSRYTAVYSEVYGRILVVYGAH